MNKKKIIGFVLVAILILGVVLVSASVSEVEPKESGVEEVSECSPSSCGLECGGKCGIPSCGCGK